MNTAILTLGIAILAMTSSKSLESHDPQLFFSDPSLPELIGNQGPLSNQHQRAGNCKCGQQYHERIIGGEDALPGEYPWRVNIITTTTDGNQGICSGAIISPNWVLTAAHCFKFEAGINARRINVYYGDVNIVSRNTVIGRHFNHPGYAGKKRGEHNDIALVQLDDPIPLGDPHRPASAICLPYKLKGDDLAGIVYGAGWGRTIGNDEDSIPQTLKKARLNLIDDCKSQLPDVDETQFCTKTPGKSPCRGDSGGSIDARVNGTVYAYGVVSHGELNCDGWGVHTRVSSYIDWIEERTGESFCKVI